MHTLLLADDNITVQRVIGLTFATEDFRIVTVSDGQAAIDLIKSEPPDIVLAGTSMPNVTGYEVASFVRSQPSLKSLPVLLLTGAFETVDPATLKASGATGVLEKPLDPVNLISRVKDLLGIKGGAPATPSPGRPVAPAQMPLDRKTPLQREAPASSQARNSGPLPLRASKASSWDQLSESSGLEPDPAAVESDNGSDAGDYLDTLDAAFDSLDRKLAGRGGGDRRQHERREQDRRPPAPPPARHGATADPRAPSRRPVAAIAQEAAKSSAIYEVDDDWFEEDVQAREERLAEQKLLAAEMGIRDVDGPAEPDALGAGAADSDLDFEFGPDGEPKAVDPPVSEPEAVQPPMPAAVAPMPRRPHDTRPPGAGPVAPPSSASAASRDVADDFAALLAFEQGEHPHPPGHSEPAPAPVIVHAAPPEITDGMLDQIAERVANRLSAGSFAEQLREVMTATVRETVREVVSDTSERIVRDEIARLKAQAERDTH